MSKALEAAKQRAKEAAERVKQLEALEEKKRARELYAFAKQRRLDETREKILLGALAQHLMTKNPDFKRVFSAEMNAYFTREDDRKLLGLPLQKAPAQQQ
jgi:hypothetical protein